MTCEKSVRPVFTAMASIVKIEKITGNQSFQVQIDTKKSLPNPLLQKAFQLRLRRLTGRQCSYFGNGIGGNSVKQI